MRVEHRSCLRALLPVPFLIVQGCSSVTTYPTSWAPVYAQPQSACGAIAGDYQNIGTQAEAGTIGKAYLNGQFSYNAPTTPLATHITIVAKDDDNLIIGYWSGRELLFEEDFACTNGIPVRKSWVGTGFGALGASTVINQFYRAEDGALIVSTSMDTKGVTMFLTPIVDHQDWWSRFETYDGEIEEIALPTRDQEHAIIAALAPDYAAYGARNEHNVAFVVAASKAPAGPEARYNVAIGFFTDANECRQQHGAFKLRSDGHPEYVRLESGTEIAFVSSWEGRFSSDNTRVIISKFTPVEGRYFMVAYNMPGRGVAPILYAVNDKGAPTALPLTHYKFTRAWSESGRFCKGNVVVEAE